MPSPLAHTLAGLATGRAFAPPGLVHPWRWYAAAVVAANAADLDLVAGWMSGHVNAFHGGVTHSLAAVLVAAACAAALPAGAIGPRWRVAALVAAAYGSHVFLDLFTGPPERTNGLRLFAPFSDAQFLSWWLPFPGLPHGPTHARLGDALEELLQWRNLRCVAVESLALGPVLAYVWLRTRRSHAPAA